MKRLDAIKDAVGAAESIQTWPTPYSDRAISKEDIEKLVAVAEKAKALLNKVDVVDKATVGVFSLAYVHGMGYTGPDYGAEREALRETLAPFDSE